MYASDLDSRQTLPSLPEITVDDVGNTDMIIAWIFNALFLLFFSFIPSFQK